MSFNVEGRSGVQVGRLLVHIAENGYSISIECDETTPVNEVQRYVESMCGISVNEQLMLCLDLKLEPQRVLGNYKLPCDGREVFVYNKVKLQANSLPPELEHIVVHEIADSPLPSTSRNPPLADSPDPALKALQSYKEQFRYHYHQGLAVYKISKEKIDLCERLLCELKVQGRALEVARENLEQFYKLVNQNSFNFMKYYVHQRRYHSDLLANSGKDIEKLKACKLHPSLQTSSRKCLLDFVSEESVIKKVQYCSTLHKQFEAKVSDFQKNYSDVKHKVEDLLSIETSSSVRNLEAMIQEYRQYIGDQKSIMQLLSKDVGIVKKLVDDCLGGGQLSSSLRPHDAVSALGPMYDIHANSHLPKMQARDKHISNLLDIFKDKKNEMNQFVHSYMQKITSVTCLIKDARLQFHVFHEVILRQQSQFADFRVLRGIGPSYRASLAEIVRRKASFKLYMGMAGQLAERLATKREAEIRRREEFLKSQVAYIPDDVLAAMGLYETPSQCIVNIAPFDTSLLDIDIQDIDRYAPEYLPGLSSRSNRQWSSRSSLFISQESSLSTDSEEINQVTVTSEDLMDSFKMLEIAGTSKMEVENMKLKAELAAKVAVICSLLPETDMESLSDNEVSNLRKETTEKTAEALHLKDEYGMHLESMLKVKHEQCVSYEKRIQELEQRLQGLKKHSTRKNTSDLTQLSLKLDECKSEISIDGDARAPCTSSSEHMEESSSISSSINAQSGLLRGISCKSQEGNDENMADYSAMRSSQLDLDTSMLGSSTEGSQVKEVKDNTVEQSGMTSSTTYKMTPVDAISPSNEVGSSSNTGESIVVLTKTQSDITEGLNELNDTESKLQDAMKEVARLGKELELRQRLLDDSQMNYALLEKCLGETREEANTNLSAAEQRASEYTSLRESTVKLLALFERLQSCLHTGMPDFVASLHAFSQSFANFSEDNEDAAFVDEFRQCIHTLAERVSFIMRRHVELTEKIHEAETSRDQLKKELNEKKELVKTLQAKQANEDYMSFDRLEVDEIAAFILNAAGHYEAINRNCSNYYLSPESVVLFTDNLYNPPNYIVGQIVHKERHVVKLSRSSRGDPMEPQQTTDLGTDKLTSTNDSTDNPYNFPVGCEYFMVTLAKLPQGA